MAKLIEQRWRSDKSHRELVPNPKKPGSQKRQTTAITPGVFEESLVYDFRERDGAIKLRLDNGEEINLTVERNMLVLNGSMGSLLVSPRSSNVVHVMVAPLSFDGNDVPPRRRKTSCESP